MAIGWLAAIQLVPWADVVSNAPKLVAAARTLWNGNAKPPTPAEVVPVAVVGRGSAEAALAAIESRLATVEALASDLDTKLAASIEVVHGLAEQNTQLIERIEANRVRTFWLLGILIFSLGLAAWALTVALHR